MTRSEEKYADIMHVGYTPSGRHARMGRVDRAAQFSPFAALTGFEEQIDESARLTDERVLPSTEVCDALNDALKTLEGRILSQPLVRLTYFKADEKKDGGRYIEKCGRLKKIDPLAGAVTFTDGDTVPMEDIRAIETQR
ncbi:MAG: hypothetical protein IK104_05045 [Clostridia bacterium]|nr:hypothetical protein [Clostridia bacterium]